jgi:transcriptional regulator with XRE-family HTH domain
MSEEWDRLARAIRARRTGLGLSRQRLAELAGVSVGAVKNLEKVGHSYERTPTTLAPVVEAIGWTRDSAANVRAGGAPTLAPGAAAPAVAAEVTERVAPRYEVEDVPDAIDDVGMIVRNTVIEVIGVLAPDTPLSEVQEIEARALKAVLQRGGRPRQRHHQAFQDPETANSPTA